LAIVVLRWQYYCLEPRPDCRYIEFKTPEGADAAVGKSYEIKIGDHSLKIVHVRTNETKRCSGS
jgi:hypothetical protein